MIDDSDRAFATKNLKAINDEDRRQDRATGSCKRRAYLINMEIDEVYQQIGESGRQQLLYGAALFLLKVIF